MYLPILILTFFLVFVTILLIHQSMQSASEKHSNTDVPSTSSSNIISTSSLEAESLSNTLAEISNAKLTVNNDLVTCKQTLTGLVNDVTDAHSEFSNNMSSASPLSDNSQVEEKLNMISLQLGEVIDKLSHVDLNWSQLDSKVDQLQSQFDGFIDSNKKAMSELSSTATEAKTTADTAGNQVKDINLALNDLSQYGRESTLLFHGFSNLPKDGEFDEVVFSNFMAEVINNMFCHTTDIRVPHSAVNIAHPLNLKRSSNSTVVIVKFNQKSLKRKIWRLREQRTDHSITITQHLTATNLELMKSAKKSLGSRNVWCEKGRLFASVNGKTKPIKQKTDIPKPHTRTTSTSHSRYFHHAATNRQFGQYQNNTVNNANSLQQNRNFHSKQMYNPYSHTLNSFATPYSN